MQVLKQEIILHIWQKQLFFSGANIAFNNFVSRFRTALDSSSYTDLYNICHLQKANRKLFQITAM